MSKVPARVRPVLVPIDAVRASTYNPRAVDPARLDLIELSLRKLGFLLPIYAAPDGEIISGHQRHTVATRMGLTHVPVAYTKPMDLEKRREVNIHFNRGTNDMEAATTTESLREALMQTEVALLAERLPDIPIDSPRFLRCLAAEDVPIKPLLEQARGRFNRYARNIAATLADFAIRMPVVIDPDGSLVNGVGRLFYEAEEAGLDGSIAAVRIDAEEVPLAHAMLNLLSMDFDLHNRYRDVLRWNAYFRSRNKRRSLPRAMLWALIGTKNTDAFDLSKPVNTAAWKKRYGTRVVDFGAGHLTATFMLRDVGVEVAAFEPWRIGEGENTIDKDLSVTTARQFLADIRDGRPFSTLFLSAVFNEVPFIEDCQRILRVVSSLATERTELHSKALSDRHPSWKQALGAEYEGNANLASFQLTYEPGIRMARTKMQRYLSDDQMRHLHSEAWSKVVVRDNGSDNIAFCSLPKPVDLVLLEEAVRFEFDLPYPDGTRMGLADEAWAAFRDRIGTTHKVQGSIAYLPGRYNPSVSGS